MESEKVNLMTLHVKGLEFNIVYLPGWEEGYFLIKSIEEKGESGLEEEEDLLVGITRAKKIAKSHFQ